MKTKTSEAAAQREQNDLTQGPITQKLLRFAAPIIISNVVMQLYNVVDSIVVGQFIGSDALAAVMVSFPVMLLFNALFMGLSMGANVLIAQYKGAGDTDGLNSAVNTAFSLSVVISAVITAAGLLLARPILTALGTPANILDDSVLYLMIIFAGTAGSVVFYLGDGLARGLGDSRWPLYVMIVSCLVNIALDLVLVVLFKWGVAGAAAATSFAYLLAGAMLLYRFIRPKYGVTLSAARMRRIDRHMAALVFRLGVPSSVQTAAMSLGMVIIQIFSNYFGSDYIASNAIIMRVDGFAVLPMFGISAAITTFVGQNTGADKPDRVRRGIMKAVQVTVGFSLCVGLLLFLFGGNLMRVFTDNRIVLIMGRNGLRFLAFCYLFMGLNVCVTGALRGAGDANAPALISILGSFIRVPIAYMLAVRPYNRDIAAAVSAGWYATAEAAKLAGEGLSHYMGLYYSMGISMACGAAMALLYYRFGRWHKKAVVRAPGGGH